ncbi:hypothetical protein SSX86_008464 [Deinandra increscens subsp. villosa]|uniref:Histone-binding protein RBBP4-like N-terminal domain-containing protein n=1 Tax=Deinandra increscens subsp. villosa TaxID=3103831 RepID=A0AAP0DG59_9ASTR
MGDKVFFSGGVDLILLGWVVAKKKVRCELCLHFNCFGSLPVNFVYISIVARNHNLKFDLAFTFVIGFRVEMVDATKKITKLDVELTIKERNLLSVGYKNVAGRSLCSHGVLEEREKQGFRERKATQGFSSYTSTEPKHSMEESAAPSPLSQPKKRGRPKGSKKLPTADDIEISPPKMKDRLTAAGNKKAAVVDDKYRNWKSVVPILYDWLANHNLVWPSLSCRWGPLLDQSKHKNRQRLYLSEQTDGSVPNTLLIANCEVVKPKVAAAEHISQFNEEARSPFVKKYKTILHPGEVNRIRELPQNKNIIATHTDCPEVLIWDIEAQPNRHAVLGASESHADLVLTGHADNAEFALAMCPTEPYVLSGGKDKYVVLWSIHDHISTLSAESTNTAGSIVKTADNASLGPRGIFQGHTDTVEDVQFCPTSTHEFCSVGDDSCLILWDARTGTNPTTKVEKAHNADVHCVDWSPHDENFILTGYIFLLYMV